MDRTKRLEYNWTVWTSLSTRVPLFQSAQNQNKSYYHGNDKYYGQGRKSVLISFMHVSLIWISGRTQEKTRPWIYTKFDFITIISSFQIDFSSFNFARFSPHPHRHSHAVSVRTFVLTVTLFLMMNFLNKMFIMILHYDTTTTDPTLSILLK
jgi:hypothetical protein